MDSHPMGEGEGGGGGVITFLVSAYQGNRENRDKFRLQLG